MNERESVKAVATAIDEAAELQRAGNEGAALGRLRRAIKENSDDFQPSIERQGERIVTTISPAWLILRAREAFLSLTLGQHKEGAHHGWLNLYEMASPVVPEANPELRFWMDRLRIVAAAEHDAHLTAAAWAFDLEDLIAAGDYADPEARLETLPALARAADALGFPRTADALHQQALDVSATPDNLARAKLSYGSFLFSTDPERALELYDEVIATLADVKSPTTGDFRELAKALRRRADGHFRAGDLVSGLRDSERGLECIEQARAKGRYTSVRSVDRIIGSDVDLLLAGVSRCSSEISSPEVALRMFLRAANSSVAAALRTDPTRDRPPRAVYLSDDSPGTVMQARLSASWAPVDDSTVESVMEAEPTLMIATTGRSSSHVFGFTLFAAGGSLTLRPWQLPDSSDALGGVLRQLMRPAREQAEEGESSAWDLPANSPILAQLAETMLPVEELGDLHAGGLRIAPIGAMWSFPFACLPIEGKPLGAEAPLVLSVPLAISTPPPSTSRWIGHFDHSLEYALRDQRNAVRAAAAQETPMRLVDRAEDLNDMDVSLFLFSGHGTGLGIDQRLRLASGESASAGDFGGIAHGASFILNACWSGNVMDVTGIDPVDLPLSLLAQGAHSVWAAFGSIGDRRAALASEALLHEVRADQTLSQAAWRAYQSLLDADPALPLREWATHSTIGRSTEYLGP
jgi:hypothetical protein